MKLSEYKRALELLEDSNEWIFLPMGPDIIRLITAFIPSFINPMDYLDEKSSYADYVNDVEIDCRVDVKKLPNHPISTMFNVYRVMYIIVPDIATYFEQDLPQIWKKPCQTDYDHMEMFCNHHNKKYINAGYGSHDDYKYFAYGSFQTAANALNTIVVDLEEKEKTHIIRKIATNMCDN